jgi:hypothetical protein
MTEFMCLIWPVNADDTACGAEVRSDSSEEATSTG